MRCAESNVGNFIVKDSLQHARSGLVAEAVVLEQEQQQLNTQPESTDDGEALLAGKFKSTEELERAYLEAQKLIGISLEGSVG